ncbi:MAG: type II toxin-antitoxin system RelE/ParE family toxin [Bacteroidales bacterium]|nr:type II toxin-antitoxin system RelE/ParE family toxin [Bacteroidales bacterium]
MNKKVVWLKSAERDMLRTADYILKEFGRPTKQNFLRETFHTATLIGTNPEMGHIEPLLSDRAITYRSIMVNDINKIVYQIKNDRIEISAFWDMRREPSTLANQVK